MENNSVFKNLKKLFGYFIIMGSIGFILFLIFLYVGLNIGLNLESKYLRNMGGAVSMVIILFSSGWLGGFIWRCLIGGLLKKSDQIRSQVVFKIRTDKLLDMMERNDSKKSTIKRTD